MYISKWKKDRIKAKRQFIGAVALAIIAVPVLLAVPWILKIIIK